MRIHCTTVQDFWENIAEESVYRRSVHVHSEYAMLNGTAEENCSSFDVAVVVTAVIDLPDGGQAIVDARERCGIDRHTQDGGLDGSRKCDELITGLRDLCEAKRLVIRPGVLDFS